MKFTERPRRLRRSSAIRDLVQENSLSAADLVWPVFVKAGSKLKELVITDSIQPTDAVNNTGNIRLLSIAGLIGEAINRTAAEQSVSSLFD